jgi:hypothetical protein
MADANEAANNAAINNNLVVQQRADFDAILLRLGFGLEQRSAIIETSGCFK